MLRAHIRVLVVAAVAGALVFGVTSVPASADQIDRIQSQQQEIRGDLNEVEQELVGAKKKVRKAVLAATAAQRALANAER